MVGWLQRLLRAPARVWAVAQVTFTQLVRMRIFVLPAVFGVGFMLLQFVPYRQSLGVEYRGVGELQLIKDIGMGCMRLFAMLFCVAATALLLPRDSEDRILYTILCKPVPRFDYLAGKALGVLAAVGVILLVTDGLMIALLELRSADLAEQLRTLSAEHGYSVQDMQPYLQELAAAGSDAATQWELVTMYLGFGVLTTLTLLISVFTSGTIVSMIFAFGAYFIGLNQEQIFGLLRATAGRGSMHTDFIGALHRLTTVVIPDFSVFSSLSAANSVPIYVAVGWSAVIAAGYMLLHLLVGAWLLSHKEF